MTIERSFPSGMVVISEIVTDGEETWLETMRYAGYSQSEAKRLYRARLKEKGWRVAE